MQRILVLCVLCAFTTALTDEHPYCAIRYKRLCQGKGRHVACQFPDSGPGPSCENYTVIRFNNDLKHFILHYVNRRRQRIASGNERVRGGLHLPKPEVMMMVEWDRELAFLAQRLADQCHFVHDDCRATVRYPYAGQTVGEVRWRRSEEPVELGARRSIRRVMDAWWGERRRVSPQQLTAPFKLTAKGAVWGHFSQLAVWTLQAMGCGAVHHGSTHPRLLLVCDFSHTNMLGQKTLAPGPLAPCPIHFVRRPRSQYPLLCAPVRYSVTPALEEDTYEEEGEGEGEELDAGVSVDGDDAPSHTDRHTKTTDSWPSSSMHSPVLVFRDDPSRTKGVMIEKLSQELEAKNKAHYKSQLVTEAEIIRQWKSRPTAFLKHWNEASEMNEEVLPLKPVMSLRTREPKSNIDMYYRPTVAATSTELIMLRHRWKPTRDRPKRPGESALLLNTPTTQSTRRVSAAPIMLDPDDTDQLFRDTGFKPQNTAKKV